MWLLTLFASATSILLAFGSLAPYLTSSSELVRMRNALVVLPSSGHDFEWTPDAVPGDFLQENQQPPPAFAKAALAIGLNELKSDWERVQAISRHLLGAKPQRVGPPIQSGLVETYRRIIESGHGYCGDYVPVFMGLALAVGIPVRSWAFSLDGFGGQGHIWVEVWNRDLRRWQLIDIYNNVFFHSGDGVAISASEFRRSMLTRSGSIKRALLNEKALPGYVHEDKMWNYYRRGLDEWFMVWGNNVFSYDLALPARLLGGISLSLEQLGSIAIGVFPGIKIIESTTNDSRVRALRQLRSHLIAVGLTVAIAGVSLLLAAFQLLRARPAVARGESP